MCETPSATSSLAADVLDQLEHATLEPIEKEWGVELVVRFGDALLKVIVVDPGHRTSLQHHVRKDEVHIILEDGPEEDDSAVRAQGYLTTYLPHTDHTDVVINHGVGKIVRVRPGTMHRATGPLVMLEVSTDHPDDVVRHQDDYGRADPPIVHS